MNKTELERGRKAYEEDLRREPFYRSAPDKPRTPWEQLPETAKAGWAKRFGMKSDA